MTFANKPLLPAEPGVALVTGASGQDGQYLTQRLAEENWEVHGVVSSSRSFVSNSNANIRLHAVDLNDRQSCFSLIESIRPDVVFNLAGISSVAKSWEDPAGTISVNSVAVSSLLEAAWLFQQETGSDLRFIQASSAEIFGNAEEVPQTESTPIHPLSPYGASKAFAHHLVQVYRARGLFASSAILYNHESPKRPPQFVTRKITSQVARIALGVGERLRLGNLDARRDWGWAPDYVDAMVKIVMHKEPDDFVIATGVSHSVRDFVSRAFEVAGVQDWENWVEVDEQFVRPTDASEMRGDPAKARTQLGWSPTVHFDEIVARMVQNDMKVERLRMERTLAEGNNA
ncbi:GDP-mannose 4,6-dehydratase [Arthrobacter sp. UC242_113]|uniref:GDP-mannose 4,6-dehydratase n=1 Tax=Arthrobacter sp. UC242_113 TaxID=3374550 RepID=UPI00375843FA